MEMVQPVNEFGPVHQILMQGLGSEALMCAVEMKLFDHLDGPEKSASEIGAETGTDSYRMEPLLNLLVAQNLLEHRDGKYVNTPTASEFLVSSSPLYQGGCMKLTMDFNRRTGANLASLLKADRPDQEERAESDRNWSVEETMEGTAQDAMSGTVQAVTRFVSGLDGFSDFKLMCDIGGNHGLFSMAALDAVPHMKAVLCDLPPVAEAARKRCERMGYGGRIETVGLDLRSDEVPDRGFDLILISHLLYGFKNDLGGVLSKIRKALRPGGFFVSQHYAPGVGDACPQARAALELMTRSAGYPSHHISREELESASAGAGLGEFKTGKVSQRGWGMIFSARKPLD